MYAFERRDKILDLLRNDGRIDIKRDAGRLGVSRSTLHRDLLELERSGVVKKVRGGATLKQDDRFATHFDIRLKQMAREKQAIARRAAETVEDDTAIFLDHSSTTHYLACELKHRQFKNLIVVTNSLAVAEELGEQRGVQVLLTGGLVESEFRALSGRKVLEFVSGFHLHQIFASVGAISMERGLMTQIGFIHELLPELFKFGEEINILIDSSKFHRIGTFQVAPLKPPLRIFTGGEAPLKDRADMEKAGVTVIT